MAAEQLDQVGKPAEKESAGASRSGEPSYTVEELLESRRRFMQPTTADVLPEVSLEETTNRVTVVDGRVESVAYPDRTVREFSYGAEGRLKSVKQPNGSVWTPDDKTGEWRSDKGQRFVGTIEVSPDGTYSYVDKFGAHTLIKPDGSKTVKSADAVSAEGASERLERLKAALILADGDQDGQVTREEVEKTLTRTDVTEGQRQALSVTLDNYEALGKLDTWRAGISKEDVSALSRMIASARAPALLHEEARAYGLAHFKELDADKDGYVAPNELRVARSEAQGRSRDLIDYLDRMSPRFGDGGFSLFGSGDEKHLKFRVEQLEKSQAVTLIDQSFREGYRSGTTKLFSIGGGFAGGALGLYLSLRSGRQPTIADSRMTAAIVGMGATAGAGLGRLCGPSYDTHRDSIHRLVQEFGGLRYAK